MQTGCHIEVLKLEKNNPNLSDKVTVRSVNHFYVLEPDKDEFISLHVNGEVLENIVPWNVTWNFFSNFNQATFPANTTKKYVTVHESLSIFIGHFSLSIWVAMLRSYNVLSLLSCHWPPSICSAPAWGPGFHCSFSFVLGILHKLLKSMKGVIIKVTTG